MAHFWTYLTKNATYDVAKGISFDFNIAHRVEILEDWGLGKRLLSYVKTYLVLGVRKQSFFVLHIGFVKSDLANFLLFPPLL